MTIMEERKRANNFNNCREFKDEDYLSSYEVYPNLDDMTRQKLEMILEDISAVLGVVVTTKDEKMCFYKELYGMIPNDL